MNTPVAPGSEVKYWVAESDSVPPVIVPDVKGLSSDSAVDQLKEKQLQPNQRARKNRSTHRKA